MKITMNYKINFAKIKHLRFIWMAVFALGIAIGTSAQVTVKAKNVPIRQILKTIEKNTEYKFFYNDNFAALDKVASLNVNNVSIDNALTTLFTSSGISWEKKDNNQIVLVPEKISEDQTQPTVGQTHKVTGTVIDESTGETLLGVSVFVEGTKVGVVTDLNGKFSINVPSSSSALVFSYIGYISKKTSVGKQTTIKVALEQDTKKLDEVVVVGYGTQKNTTLTGSISQIKGKEFVKSPQANVSNSLAGRVSGIIANNRSGEPGYDGSTFYIRGMSTTGNNDVLIVVDGVPGQIGGLDRLDPNDIASISVLKDASAAIYGSRAANGAILVTTKRGTSGKPALTYSFSQGISSPTRLPKVADASTYAAIRNEIEYYNNKAGGMNQVYSATEIQKFADGSDPINYPNTDWQSETLKSSALQNQHSLSLTGGTENVKYYVSLGTIHQEGIYKNGATKYNQYNVRSNIDATITNRLKVGVNLSGRQEDRQYPMNSAGNIFRSIYRAYPTTVATYPNGYPSTGIENNNPVVMATDMGGLSKNPTYVLNGSLKAVYSIPYVDGLTLEGMLSTDKSFNFTKSFNTPYLLYNYNKTTNAYTPSLTGGSAGKARLDESNINTSLVTANIKLNYSKQFGKHSINSFFVYEESTNKVEQFGATRLNFPTIQTPELSPGGSAAADKDNSGYSTIFTRRSYIGRLAYDFGEKYMAEAQFRVDGSSIFPKGKQYGFFPSVSAGWRISQEDWFKNNVSFINDLKFRVSYGILGNDNVSAYQYYNNYSFANNYVIGSDIQPGIDLIKLANPNITWETSKKTDIGFNAKFLKNFTMEFIYFKQVRSNILAVRNASIPAISGIVNPYNDGGSSYNPLVPSENIGKINNGGFEATLGYSHEGDFSYNIAANVTYAKSKIINIDEAAGLLDYQKQTGLPLNTYLLYNATGIFRTQADLDNNYHLPNAQLGDLIFQDRNGDKKITADDMVRTKYGNVPELTYGINMGAAWKNIDISLVFSGQAMVSNYVLAESGTIGNFYSAWADNRWSPTNVNGSYPRVDTRSSSSINGGLNPNTFWLDNSAFIRLKNIALGYTLPQNIISRVGLSKVRVYVNAFNLLTITKVKDYDPEGNNQSAQFYPQQRIINMGVNINF